MDVRTPADLERFAEEHPDCAASLWRWYRIAPKTTWTTFREVRESFPNADSVKLASGRTVVVFNIGGNNYRLIAVVVYPLASVVVHMLLTHAEYDKEKWKRLL